MTGDVTRRDGTAEVTGALTFQTVTGALARSSGWLAGPDAVTTIDLKGVTRADSAGLALLLEWQGLARAAGRQVRFANMPEQVRHIIEVSGLTHIFNTD